MCQGPSREWGVRTESFAVWTDSFAVEKEPFAVEKEPGKAESAFAVEKDVFSKVPWSWFNAHGAFLCPEEMFRG